VGPAWFAPGYDKTPVCPTGVGVLVAGGGATGARTPDLLHAMQMLFQLSYRPAADIVTNRQHPGWRVPSWVHPTTRTATMAGVSIDLNADVGEGLDAVDEAILPLITSANIACGGHAGDEQSMRRVVQLAVLHDVAIGAHPAYPDGQGFGRRELEISLDELRLSLAAQIESLAEVAAASDTVLGHVKPHGSLYNRAAADRAMADLVADVVRAVDPGLTLVGLAGSELVAAGRAAGLAVAAEAFADRAYEPDGSLRSRSLPGAVFESAEAVAAQAVSIAADGRVALDDGGLLEVRADTLCLHSDSPGAVENARAVRAALAGAGMDLLPVDVGASVLSGLPTARVVPFGERAFLSEFGVGVDESTHDRVHALTAAITAQAGEFGLGESPVAGYTSVLVSFDPESVEPTTVADWLEALASQRVADAAVREPVVHQIPVRYGGADGPDLEEVASRTGLEPDHVIESHLAADYRVYLLGFSPGFGYLGPLPPSLRLPRRDEPRLRVAPGSVAIAGAQTAVYPHQTAGGWHILGRTDERLWDASAERPALLRPGDRVRFVRV
jgi:UPF0271 protein